MRFIFSFIFSLVVLLFVVYLFSYSSMAIDHDKKDNLTNMINTIDRDDSDQKFRAYFKTEFNKDLDDQKIDNGEYKDLKEVYDGYMLSKLTDNQNVFLQNLEKKQQETARQDKMFNQMTQYMWVVILGLFFIVFFVVLVANICKVLKR